MMACPCTSRSSSWSGMGWLSALCTRATSYRQCANLLSSWPSTRTRSPRHTGTWSVRVWSRPSAARGRLCGKAGSASRQNALNTWWRCWSSRLATPASRLTISLNDLRNTDSILRKTMTREEVHECDRNDWRQQVVWTITGAGRHVPDCPDGQHLRPDGAKWLGQDDQHQADARPDGAYCWFADSPRCRPVRRWNGPPTTHRIRTRGLLALSTHDGPRDPGIQRAAVRLLCAGECAETADCLRTAARAQNCYIFQGHAQVAWALHRSLDGTGIAHPRRAHRWSGPRGSVAFPGRAGRRDIPAQSHGLLFIAHIE